MILNNIVPAGYANPKRAKLNSKFQAQFANEKDFIERRLAAMKMMQSKRYNKFPVTSGLSGHVFQTGRLYVSNDYEKETSFVDEIDNQTNNRQVKNFMIGPVYGIKDKKRPLGIIQFINKAGSAKIQNEDRHKFQEMADLIGLCIENTNSITETINVTLQINERIRNINQIMSEEKLDNELNPGTNILDELTDRFSAIKVQTHKLIKDRQEEKHNSSNYEQAASEFKKAGFK